MNERSNELVEGFRQSAPYVNAHRGKTFVIMLAGEAVQQASFRDIINDIALLNSLGIKIVLVYGARPQINHQLDKIGHQVEYYQNVRVTDDESFSVIKQVAGSLQLDITARLSMSLSNTPMHNAQINVVSGNFIIAQPLGVVDGVDYCHSGRIRRIDVNGIERQLNHNGIVLIGPVAVSITGESFNLTTEEIASQVAIKLKADKLIGFTTTDGILGVDGEVIPELLPSQAEKFLSTITEDTPNENFALRTFLRAGIASCKAGVSRCHLVSSTINGSLLQELFSRDGIGTQIAMEPSEQLRFANINDIGGILNLIRPLEQQGVLVRRSREQLEMEVNQFVVIERDGLVIGCAAFYPFEDENVAEFACLAVHPEYRDADRGSLLLKYIISTARKLKYKTLFALTTTSIHWFLEHGFEFRDVSDLPEKKQQLYNYQRKSKVLAIDLNASFIPR
ncbi:amino-acid N-acetyltransferase [Algibacillus agarilyticus]|uniref:amino-acid N-acetyltransferase n=1 Tax=Algibacillus agarilyticus TaxID=2234133 RepID=UPI000DD0DC50|nr:amino-acid N-acetyltransferase [Algibacillus agarilyticus]